MKSLLRLYFAILLLNLLIVSCIFFTKFQNIARSKIPPSSSPTSTYTSSITYINAFLILSLIMLSIQIILLLVGLPFAKEPFAIQILFQILGVICYGLYVLLRMPYQTISYIWGVFCLVPFVFGVASVIYRSVGYKKYSIVDYSSDNPRPPVRKQTQP